MASLNEPRRPRGKAKYPVPVREVRNPDEGQFRFDCTHWVWWFRHPFYNLMRVVRVKRGFYDQRPHTGNPDAVCWCGQKHE